MRRLAARAATRSRSSKRGALDARTPRRRGRGARGTSTRASGLGRPAPFAPRAWRERARGARWRRTSRACARRRAAGVGARRARSRRGAASRRVSRPARRASRRAARRAAPSTGTATSTSSTSGSRRGSRDAGAVDCIEFSEALRRIDTASEVAFLAMDLAYRGRARPRRALPAPLRGARRRLRPLRRGGPLRRATARRCARRWRASRRGMPGIAPSAARRRRGERRAPPRPRRASARRAAPRVPSCSLCGTVGSGKIDGGASASPTGSRGP